MNETIPKIFDNLFDFFQKKSLSLLVFFVGLLNSRRHIAMLNIPFIDKIIIILFTVLLIINFFIIFINYFHSKKSFLKIEINKYWLPLILIVLLKYLILFLQILYIFINKISYNNLTINLFSNYPIYSHIKNMLRFIVNFFIIFILTSRIDSFSKLSSTIDAFGFGCSVAPIIGLVFFPNLIGKRISDVGGVFFSGSIWNASVIAFVSVGWLLFGNIYNNDNRLKKFLYLLIPIIMFVGGIAGLSRAIVVSGFVSLLIYIICLKDLKKLIKIIAILIILIIIIQLQFGIIFENFKERLKAKSKISNEGRIQLWKDYLEDIKSFFFLGESIEGYLIFSKTEQGPHSVILNWWSQFGIIAVIAFIWLMWGIWKSATYIYKNLGVEKGAAVYAWIFAYLTLAMINETGYREFPFYTAMGIIFAWGNLAKNKSTEDKELTGR